MAIDKSIMRRTDSQGHFGQFGGQYVPEELLASLRELEEAYKKYADDKEFREEFAYYLKDYSGRPTSVYFAERLSEEFGPNVKVYLKREDLNHTGAHKINNAIGQALLAIRMGKKKVVAETGAGQHGVATATVCAKFGLECIIFMGAEDMRRQSLNVFRMRLLGAEVRAVNVGTRTLSDAVDEAIKYWVENVDDTYYLLGSAVGPHPFPVMVRDFQSVIGKEAKNQILEKEGRLPDYAVACIGGGSNAIGLFDEFVPHEEVKLVGVEAAGMGIDTNEHAASLTKGMPGVLHGSKSYILQNEDGSVKEAYSISAGLDYPGVGPEHAYLQDIGRAKYISVTDAEAIEAFKQLCQTEGIIPALESSHALAALPKIVEQHKNADKEILILLNLSGRGDKDVEQVAKYLGVK